MRAAWHCGSVAPIRADAALQGCAAFRIALLAPLLGAAPVKALPIWRGTGSSNLSPSSAESVANRDRGDQRRRRSVAIDLSEDEAIFCGIITTPAAFAG